MRRLFSALWIGAALLAAFAPGTLRAQMHEAEVGRVIVAVGRFSAIQPGGEMRSLARRAPIYNGDTLVTGQEARAQIRFSDGTLVALHPASQFRVDDFRFDGTADGDENAAFTLLKGGMRTITGVIGKQNKEKYQVRTDVATIGVRGTHYVLQQCTGNCGVRGEGLYGGVVQGAIVVTNDSGATVINTDQFFHVSDAGTGPQLLLAPPDLLFSGEEPELETAPAQQDEGGEGDGRSDSGGEQSGEGGTGEQSSAPQSSMGESDATGESAGGSDFGGDTPVTAPAAAMPPATDTTSPTTSIDIALNTGTDIIQSTPDTTDTTDTTETTSPYPSAPNGAVMGLAFVSRQGAGDYDGDGGSFRQGEGTSAGTSDIGLGSVDGSSNVPMAVKIYSPDHTETINGVTELVPGCSPCTMRVGQATLLDAGGLDEAGMAVNWGRWEGDVVVTDNDVITATVGSVHYIYSPNETPYSTVASMSGTYYYNLVGGTSPTDEQGVAGVLSGAYIDVDFTNQNISNASLFGDVNGKSFSAYTTSSVPLADLYQSDKGIDVTGSCYGGACGAMTTLQGHMSANFVGPNAERIISAYGLEQAGTDPSPIAISGTAVLEASPGY